MLTNKVLKCLVLTILTFCAGYFVSINLYLNSNTFTSSRNALKLYSYSNGNGNGFLSKAGKTGKALMHEPQSEVDGLLKLKRILIWTLHYEDEPLSVLGEFRYKQSQICEIKCEFVDDRRLLGSSHAVVFHSRDMKRDDFPPIHHRDRSQRWIYLQTESPIHTKRNLKLYSNVFNWTMTYRKDSDIFYPYGQLLPLTDSEKAVIPKFKASQLTQKSKLVAWVVSNCWSKSGREDFVEELQSHVSVDVFGYCGDYYCSGADCFSLIENNYKFYLSIENSLCKEYITEKLFNALNMSIVPIVYGLNTDYSSIAPKNSYIDASRFRSTKELAEYLLYLDKNPQEYSKYFEWKNQYKVIGREVGWCSLCRLLNSKSANDTKSYHDIWKWWHFKNFNIDNDNSDTREPKQEQKPMCLDPQDLQFPATPMLRKIWKALKVLVGWKNKMEIT